MDLNLKGFWISDRECRRNLTASSLIIGEQPLLVGTLYRKKSLQWISFTSTLMSFHWGLCYARFHPDLHANCCHRSETVMAQLDATAEACNYTGYADKFLTYPPAGPLPLPGTSTEFDRGCDVWTDIFNVWFLLILDHTCSPILTGCTRCKPCIQHL